MTSTVRKENEQLKQQLNILKKQLNLYKKQLNDFKKEHKPLPRKNIPKKNKNTGIETTLDRNAAANALMAKLGAKKPSKPPPNKPAIKTSNALTTKVGSLKSKHTSTPNVLNLAAKKPNNKATFKKYEIMLKVGVDLSGVLTQMRKDNLDKDLINEFNKSHGGSDDNDDDMDPIELAKKLKLPSKIRINPPKQQMKRLHWEPVKLKQIKTSIWNKVNQQWHDYEKKVFELFFQTRTVKPKINKVALKKGVGTPSSRSLTNDDIKEDDVLFVTAKRSQQVQIGLKSFNMTNEELRQAILTLNDSKMDSDKIKQLIDITPTPAEQLIAERISQDKDVKYFGIVERFFYSLYDIIELKPRLVKWRFKLQFRDEINKLESLITTIEKAKLAITRSSNLKAILAIILGFGNHMNYGVKVKGNAYGFHINDLTLLPQIKTFDNSMTFPMFLYSFIEKKNANLLQIKDEFKIVTKASSITSEAIEKVYENLSFQVKDLKQMLERYKTEYFETLSLDDKFIDTMSGFYTSAKKKMWKLKFKYDSYHRCEKQLIEYFAYNSDDSINIQKVFKDLCVFIKMLQDSKTKLNELEVQRKKKAAERQRKLRRKRKMRRRRRSNSVIMNRKHFKNFSINKKYISPRKSPKRYAMGIDDVGTPLDLEIDNNINNVNTNPISFTDMVMKRNSPNHQQKVSQNLNNYGRFRYKIAKKKPKPNKNPPPPAIKPLKSINAHPYKKNNNGRRNSLENTPENEHTKMVNGPLAAARFDLRIKANDPANNSFTNLRGSVTLFDSHSKLTPITNRAKVLVDATNKKSNPFKPNNGNFIIKKKPKKKLPPKQKKKFLPPTPPTKKKK